ncbi:unnamed protein product [Macrosiphum euphorbiae]|uniref:Uncharacterized protein n=1 Tax=Macrosiphum euphorbiae TaxID=13131 RepID=A0AAV0WMS7_9HEMI|nr:unnamed protein product [Macrosiphum euphorbiae]
MLAKYASDGPPAIIKKPMEKKTREIQQREEYSRPLPGSSQRRKTSHQSQPVIQQLMELGEVIYRIPFWPENSVPCGFYNGLQN